MITLTQENTKSSIEEILERVYKINEETPRINSSDKMSVKVTPSEKDAVILALTKKLGELSFITLQHGILLTSRGHIGRSIKTNKRYMITSNILGLPAHSTVIEFNIEHLLYRGVGYSVFRNKDSIFISNDTEVFTLPNLAFDFDGDKPIEFKYKSREEIIKNNVSVILNMLSDYEYIIDIQKVI